MKPFHKSCGSSNLSTIEVKKRNRSIFFDKCDHCDKIIESYEIDNSMILLNKAISNIKFSQQPDDIAKMIILSCRK